MLLVEKENNLKGDEDLTTNDILFLFGTSNFPDNDI